MRQGTSRGTHCERLACHPGGSDGLVEAVVPGGDDAQYARLHRGVDGLAQVIVRAAVASQAQVRDRHAIVGCAVAIPVGATVQGRYDVVRKDLPLASATLNASSRASGATPFRPPSAATTPATDVPCP